MHAHATPLSNLKVTTTAAAPAATLIAAATLVATAALVTTATLATTWLHPF